MVLGRLETPGSRICSAAYPNHKVGILTQQFLSHICAVELHQSSSLPSRLLVNVEEIYSKLILGGYADGLKRQLRWGRMHSIMVFLRKLKQEKGQAKNP